MRHLLATLVVLVAVATAVGYAAFRTARDDPAAEARAGRDALAWLRAEFRLDEAQFAAVGRLHASYSVVCEEHCRAIQDAARARTDLRAAGSAPEVLAAAERRVQELRTVCETAIATHVRQVAALMSPAQGERYLALVLPKIADFDHRAAPDAALGAAHRH